MGAVSYFVIEATGAIVWVAAKSRVSPMKETNVDVNGSIPRLELAAAVIGVELSTQIKEDIDVQITREVFFTDSTTVYFWIQGKDGKHPVFVANRLNKIHLTHPDSPPKQWRWVPTSLNPADVVSRGAMPDDTESWNLFHEGPRFIACPEDEWPSLPVPDEATVGASDVDPPIQESSSDVSCIEKLLRRKSDFQSVKRILSYVLRFIGRSRKQPDKFNSAVSSLPSALELQQVEDWIVRDCQSRHFQAEIAVLVGQDPKKIKRVLNR